MADTFQYGTVTLTHVKTESFDQSTEYDPSNTDQLWTRTTLTVTGILAAGLNPAKTGETAADVLRRIEHNLNRPRQYLRYQIGNKTVIEIGDPNNPTSALDVAKGPLPKGLSTVMITEGSIEIRFTVTCATVACDSGGAAATRGFASNRWSQKETYDKTGYCTLVTTGLLIGRTDLRVTPDQMRGAIAPPVRQGYQREFSNYTLSEDGLRLSYDYQDKEYYLPPPLIEYQDANGNVYATQALEANGEMTVVSSAHGSRYMGIVTCTLKGPKGLPKYQLLGRAIAIAKAMISPFIIRQVPINGGANVIPGQELRVSHRYYESEVSVQLTGSLDYAAVKAALPGGGGPIGLFDQIPLGSQAVDQPGISPTIRGNGQFLQMLGATFQDPCVFIALLQADLTSVDQIKQISGGQLTGSNVDLSQYGSGAGGNVATAATGITSTSYSASPGVINNAKPGANGNPNVLQRINPASIGVGQISQTQPPLSDIAYDIWLCNITYDYDTGVVVLPSTKAGQLASKIRVRNALLYVTVTWSVQRTGKPPMIPDPCPEDNYVLIGMMNLEAPQLEQTPTGSIRYKMSGCYRYAALDMCKVPVVNPVPPFLIEQMNLTELVGTNLDLNQFKNNAVGGQLIGGGGGIGGGQLVGGQVDLNQFKDGAGGAGNLFNQLLGGNVGANNNPPNGGGVVAGGGNAGTTSRGQDVGPLGIYQLERGSVWYALKTIKPDQFFCDGYCK